MADFQVIRRKGRKPATEQPQELTQEDQSSLLSKAGAGAMSGLHTVGSILSWPSRLVHGAINAAVGGKEGFGENYLNPFDSRGGVEGSRHLINAGILAENNPNEWEWGDLGRGLADLALDPTTYMGPGLTKLGRAAEKGGTLAAGRIAQTANNQRALLNIGLPFSDPIVSIGTGAGTAKALSTIGKKTGLTAATNAVKKSYPVRALGALFDARKLGLTHATAQEQAVKATDELRKLQTATRADINRAIRTEELAKMHQDDLRRGLEGAEKSAVEGGYVPHPAASESSLEPHVMLHINPQHDLLKAQYPDAIDTGVLDEVLQAGKPVTAPLMHLDETGKPVLGKGKVNLKSKDVSSLAKKAFDDELAALQKTGENIPMWADPHPWQMTREEFASQPDVVFHGSRAKNVVDLKPNHAPQWGEAVYFAKNRDVSAGDFGLGGELHMAKLSPDAKLFDASAGGLPAGYKDTKAWKSYVDDLAKKYPDEDASSIAYLAEDQLAEHGDVARKILQEQGYHGVTSQHPDYGVETAIFDPSKFTTHKQSVARALKEGKPVSQDILAEYPDLAKLAAKNAPFSVTDVLHLHFPESMNTATVPFRELSKITGKTPAEIVEALKKEIPGGYTLQPHDFPEQIVSEGRQGEHFWHPKDPAAPGSHDKPFVGFSLHHETGKQIAAAKAAAPQMPVAPVAKELHPDRIAFEKQLADLKKSRKAKIQEHAARIAAEIQAKHGSEDALATLAKMRDLKEPGMAVMVPQSQAEQIRRMLSGGKKERNVSDATNAVRGSKEYEHIAKGRDEMLSRQRERGFGMGEELHDPTIDYFPRRESITSAEQAAGDVSQRGSSIMPAQTAEDTARKWFFTGHHGGTPGINQVLKDEVLHDIAATGKVADVEAALRQRHGHMIDGLYQDRRQRAMVQKTLKAAQTFEARALANEQKIADITTPALDAARKSTDPESIKAVKAVDKRIARLKKKVDAYRQKHAEALAAHEEAIHAGHDRIPALAKYIKNNPQLRGVDKFGNNPLVDYAHARLSNDRKYAMANAVYGTISKELNKGDQAVTLRDFLTNKGYKLRTAAERIAGREFEDAADLKAFLDGNTIDSGLAKQLNSLTPAFKAPDAVNELTDKMKSSMAWWKGLTLAFPASRVRDAVGGVVQNVLHGWADPRFLAEDARLLLTGKIVKRDYSHVPEIKDWLAKTGKKWSPENQTEALRQLAATYLPSEHSILADVPTGQVGAGIEQLMHNIPGLQQTTAFNQFIGDPMRALAGKDPGGASWFGRGTPDDTILSRTAKAAAHPFTGVRGVGDATETMLAPVKASEIVAANSDAYNRTAPFLQQVFGGTRADVAANKVNRAQIDYDPSTFTAFERGIKNYVAPFYCVPTDHEILTRDGWKFHDELTVGEEVMAYDLATEGLHWTPLQAVNVYDFDGELNVLHHNKVGNGKENFRTVEFLFTDDHRWPTIIEPRMIPSVTLTRQNGGVATKALYKGLKKFVRGADLQSQHKIPHSGKYHGDNEESILDVRLAKILGWVVTDGYHRWRKRRPEHNPHLEMMVYQSPSKHLDAIIELLGTTPRKPHPDTGVVCVPVSHADVSELKKVFKSKEDLPRIASRLSPEAAAAMWQVMMDAEGSDNGKNSPHFAQCGPNSTPVIEAFQILCLMTGRSANVSSRGCYVKKSKGYCVHRCLQKRRYTGQIWCPTTAYGTWIMRHNGAMIITGNSFNSRILPETARELSNFGSPTSQLIKTIDRAHGGGDASVPDYVMSGTGIPLGTRADGSKSYLTGLGQMYEPAVSQLGLLAGGITDPRSLRAAGFDTLAQLNPMIGTPLQRITGQSFFQRGEPISNLDPIAGRTLSNIGESLGLRSQDEGPVQFPGSAYLDTALGATPFGRAIGQVRTLADPRKDIASKLVDTMSGARVTDISPEKQMATLQKRAEDLARSQGAWEQRTVGFPKEQLAKLALTNPELAAEQQHLQNMITAMKRKRTIRRKEKKAAEKK